MDKKLLKKLELIKKDQEIFLNYLQAKFPVFHNSNFFFRDLQYGIKQYLEKKDMDINAAEAEELAKNLAAWFEEEGIFIPVNKYAWKVNYPEFTTKVPGDPF